MDEQMVRGYATEACKRYSDEFSKHPSEFKIEGFIFIGESELKLRGISRKPLSNVWLLNFNWISDGSSDGAFQIPYVPDPNASDEEQIEAIIKLLKLQQSYR